MPLDRILEIAADQKIGIWNLSESVSELLERLPLLSGSPDLARCRTQRRKAEWLAARALYDEMGYDYRQISYNSSGKPVLADNSGFLSISHSDGLVAVMYSEYNACGIDVQRIKGDTVLKGMHFFMSEEEQELVNSSPHPLLSAFTCWSAKEACFKMGGESSDTLKSFVVRRLNWKSPETAVVSLNFGETGQANVSCWEMNGYILAYCSTTQGMIF